MNRLLILALVTVATGCSAGSGDPTLGEPQSYVVSEQCTSTTTCPDGGTSSTVYSYTTGPSDWDTVPDGGAVFVPGGSTGTTTPCVPNPDAPGVCPDGGTSSGGSTSGGGTSGGGTSGGDSGGMCTTTVTCNPGCTNPDGSPCSTVPPSQGGCWVTGGGYIVDSDGNDSFGGNAMPMKAGNVRGEWEHVDHGTSHKGHGEVQYIVCRNVPNEPGPGHPNGPQHSFDINQVYFGGPARWFENGAWSDGFWFDVFAEDHGEPGNSHAASHGNGSSVPDYYHYTIRKMVAQNQSGAVVYDTEGPLVGGNMQIHPPNNGHPYNGGALPSWVSLQP